MAATDPRETIMAIVDNYLVANPLTKDLIPGATHLCIWEKGPETLKYLFYGTPNIDVLFTFGEPRSRSVREIQDIPVHFLMRYPISITTVDKPLTGTLVCTAARMQYKATWAIRRAIAGLAQSGVGATPAYTLTLKEDVVTHKRVGGLDVWEATHFVEYQTDYV